jgi:hypothetical protein
MDGTFRLFVFATDNISFFYHRVFQYFNFDLSYRIVLYYLVKDCHWFKKNSDLSLCHCRTLESIIIKTVVEQYTNKRGTLIIASNDTTDEELYEQDNNEGT